MLITVLYWETRGGAISLLGQMCGQHCLEAVLVYAGSAGCTSICRECRLY